jgi:putative flippase GtrA
MTDEGALKTLFGQLVRFGLVGGFSTILYAAIYWPLATYVVHPVLAVFIAFSIAVAVGYVLHSNWSFRGHGKGSEGGRTQAKFLSVQSVGMVLNALFTWILTGPLFHGPTWWPLVPAVLVTPLVTFALNRWWVFG